jgi:hypothetical protein
LILSSLEGAVWLVEDEGVGTSVREFLPVPVFFFSLISPRGFYTSRSLIRELPPRVIASEELSWAKQP